MTLPFETNALEPHMDKETVEIHHGKHHQGYVNKLNAAIEGRAELQDKPIEDLLKDLDSISEEVRQSVINNGGGVYNHNVFWSILGKDAEFNEESEIGKAIIEKWETFEAFQKEFSDAAATVFGSGWAWLILNNNQLEIVKTFNQNSPISKGMIPLIALDVWEHSYYLKYQNRRPDYIGNFWSIVDWDKVNGRYVTNKQ